MKATHFVSHATLAIACLAVALPAASNCQTYQPASAAHVAGGQADALFKSMIAACAAQDSSRWRDLRTERVNTLLARLSEAENKRLDGDHCALVKGVLAGLNGKASAAVHSIGPYKNRTECGIPAAYWFIHDPVGKPLLRLEVALEQGRLKIDTH
jgi:hypothetical protein